MHFNITPKHDGSYSDDCKSLKRWIQKTFSRWKKTFIFASRIVQKELGRIFYIGTIDKGPNN
jgi:hypothetical protein